MKVIKNDDFNIEVFLGKENFDLDCKDELEDYLKKFFNRLKEYYDIEVKGFYDIYIYIDKNYGVVLDINRDDIDFEPIFNSIDMKIILKKENFLYKLDEYKYEHYGNIYYYDGAYYLEIFRKISDIDFMYLMEEANVVYKDIDIIKKRGKKVLKVL